MKSGGFLWYAVVGMINADNVKNNSNAKAVLDEMLAWTALQWLVCWLAIYREH